MIVYIIHRLIQAAFTIIITTLVVFLIMRLLPGDPILLYISQNEYRRTSEQDIANLRTQFGLDKPLLHQYISWVGGIFRGDLGKSIFAGTTVTEEIGRALPITLHLGVIAFIVGHLIGISVGMITAVRRGTWVDSILTALANIGICAPIFWVGILMIYFFGLYLDWLPTQGYTSPFTDFWLSTRQIIMPSFCLALPAMSTSARQTRSAMLEVIRQDYIRTAWAKGLQERTVIMRHAVKNSIIPVVTLVGMSIPLIFGGAVVIEVVFNIPGMGRLGVNALFSSEYALIQGIILVIGSIIVLSNLIVDISYGWIDPRIRYR